MPTEICTHEDCYFATMGLCEPAENLEGQLGAHILDVQRDPDLRERRIKSWANNRRRAEKAQGKCALPDRLKKALADTPLDLATALKEAGIE